jgi:glycosyltransferase involved in cell wall biosynthesis
MQAGAMGLASIVSDINGCNEIVEDGVNGLIVPPKDEDTLYDAMGKLVQDNDFKVSLSKDARKMIVDRYDQQFVWDAIKDEYDLLLGEKSV